eukprot:COSAG01_NODE_3912_length_5546_cov_49.202680_7_plen_424_part_00
MLYCHGASLGDERASKAGNKTTMAGDSSRLALLLLLSRRCLLAATVGASRRNGAMLRCRYVRHHFPSHIRWRHSETNRRRHRHHAAAAAAAAEERPKPACNTTQQLRRVLQRSGCAAAWVYLGGLMGASVKNTSEAAAASWTPRRSLSLPTPTSFSSSSACSPVRAEHLYVMLGACCTDEEGLRRLSSFVQQHSVRIDAQLSQRWHGMWVSHGSPEAVEAAVAALATQASPPPGRAVLLRRQTALATADRTFWDLLGAHRGELELGRHEAPEGRAGEGGMIGGGGVATAAPPMEGLLELYLEALVRHGLAWGPQLRAWLGCVGGGGGCGDSGREAAAAAARARGRWLGDAAVRWTAAATAAAMPPPTTEWTGILFYCIIYIYIYYTIIINGDDIIITARTQTLVYVMMRRGWTGSADLTTAVR